MAGYYFAFSTFHIFTDLIQLCMMLVKDHPSCNDDKWNSYGTMPTLSVIAAILCGTYGLALIWKCKNKKLESGEYVERVVLPGLFEGTIVTFMWVYGINNNCCAMLSDLDQLPGKLSLSVAMIITAYRTIVVFLGYIHETQEDLLPAVQKNKKSLFSKNMDDNEEKKMINIPPKKTKRSMSITEVIVLQSCGGLQFNEFKQL